jgi:hypothetical protein
MIIGTAYFAMAETTKAGKAVGYSAAGVMTGTLTKARHSVATILDGVDSVLHPFGTRMHRVFFWGQYGVNIANTESLWAGD